MTSLVLLLLRLTVGGLLIGHGGQKLFGWFGGSGIEGTTGWLASLRLRPAREWAVVAGMSELGGGLLTALGFLNPLGPIAAMGPMLMAWAKVHLGKPIWVTTGGAELPLTNLAVLTALSLRGPGKLSLDRLMGIRLPRWVGLLAVVGVVGAVVAASQPELAGGQSVVAEAGGEVDGDPSMDEQDQEDVRAAGDLVDEAESGAGSADREPADVAAMERPAL